MKAPNKNHVFSSKGSDHPAYKNGSGKGHQNRISKAFREAVAKCSKCRSTLRLETHHIDSNPRNNSTDNLDVLCRCCHAKTHRKYKTKKQAKQAKRKRDIAYSNKRREEKELLIKTILKTSKYFQAKDVCKKLGVTKEAVRLWRVAGRYDYKKIGGGYYYLHMNPR